jgi:ribosomal protein S18 acetylase RimI-like enzyme
VSRFFSEALAKHDRTTFASGNDRIDGYFRASVSQDTRRRYAACYVLIEKATNKLAGFYTLSSTNIPLTNIPPEMARKLPRYPSVPAVLIGWLGRDLAFRGEDIGAMLLYDAIVRTATSPAGVHAICADAIDEAAAAFYLRHQFTPVVGKPLNLFIPLATVLELIRGE